MRLVIGCGTGRSGTHSLNDLFNSDPDICSFHEGAPGLPWVPHPQRLDRFVDELRGRAGWELGQVDALERVPLTGHVAYWHLNYIPYWATRHDSRIVGVIRDKSSTVASMVRAWNRDIFDGSRLPFYPGDMAQAAGRYWEEYTRHLRHFADLYPYNVMLWPLTALNSDEDRARILTWAKRA